MSLTVENIFKKYGSMVRKSKYIIEDLSLNIEEGQVYALVGQNGAGKTTTIKCILKYIRMDKGIVKVNNKDIEKLMEINKVGYLPENLIYPSSITLKEFLFDICVLRGMNRDVAMSKIEELTLYFGLKDVINKNINKFSKGMKRKIGYIQAIINEPKVLILDEPTDGLDPISRKQVLKSIREIADKGNIVMITSHILADLGLISDKIGLIEGGRLVSEIEPMKYLKNKKYKIALELYRGTEKEELSYEIKPSTIIKVNNIDKCVIQDIFLEAFDLEEWYYNELSIRRPL